MGVKLETSQLQAKVMRTRKDHVVNALSLFRPTEQQEPFFRRMAGETILEVCVGGGNRAGKSLIVAAWFAAIALNQPITLRDGTQLHMRPPLWRNEPLKLWLVGYDLRHCGKTLYRLLFKKDPFRIIRDQNTGKWRTYDPTNAEDKEAYSLTRPSPPLIQMSDVEGGEDGIAWENKKERQFSSLELAHDGTRIEVFPSTGERPQGDPAHAIWVDEKLHDEEWYSELLARLMDYRGRILWTSWPTTAPSAVLSELEERAATQRGKPDARSFAFTLSGSDNPYTQSAHRQAILATMDEDTRAARDKGIANADRWRVYPRFSRFVHRVYGPDPDGDDDLAKEVRKLNGIPNDWTRYLILDPGTANPAVLFVAVPPPKFGDFIVPYDELYVHYINARELAQAVAGKTRGQMFEDFIIDSHAGRMTPMGFDTTVQQNYEKYFAEFKLRSARHGSHFTPGTDDVASRIMRVQGSLNIRENNTPQLRILGCPNLVKQLEGYKWQKDARDNPTDKPALHQKVDVAACLEYHIASDNHGYVKPKVAANTGDPLSYANVMAGFKKIMGIETKPRDGSVYCGPGLAPQT